MILNLLPPGLYGDGWPEILILIGLNLNMIAFIVVLFYILIIIRHPHVFTCLLLLCEDHSHPEKF